MGPWVSFLVTYIMEFLIITTVQLHCNGLFP